MNLPYFDVPRMLIIDPMHNLFLGSAKYFTKKILIERGYISREKLQMIQERVNSCIVPSGIGRIPVKIQSVFSNFTADQWKNWVLYFSILVLHDIITGGVMECWQHFVLACRKLVHSCQPPKKNFRDRKPHPLSHTLFLVTLSLY